MNPPNPSSVIATARQGEYVVTVYDTDDHQQGRQGDIWAQRDNWEPVFLGYWMDWPEQHWAMTEAEYHSRSRVDRAHLECVEQLERYVGWQYGTLWLEAYRPERLAAIDADGLKRSEWERVSLLAESIRAES